MSNRTREFGTITEMREGNPSYFTMVVRSPKIAKLAEPGQFVFVRLASDAEEILRRPISISAVRAGRGELVLEYRVVGKGTERISRMQEGETVDLMGPIGTPFPVEDAPGAVLVAGGMGVAPLFFLARELQQRNVPVTVYIGAKTKEQLLLTEELSKLATVYTSTEEEGRLVTDLLPDAPEAGTVVYACGPVAMLAKVQAWAEAKGLSGYVSLEERLACGIGACSGCAFPMRGAEGKTVYKKVCVDGPVFPLKEVLFHE